MCRFCAVSHCAPEEHRAFLEAAWTDRSQGEQLSLTQLGATGAEPGVQRVCWESVYPPGVQHHAHPTLEVPARAAARDPLGSHVPCQWVLSWLLPRCGAALGVLLWEGAALSCSVGRALSVQSTQSGISQPGCFLPMGAAWHPVAGVTPTSQCSLEKQLGAPRACCCQTSSVQLSHSCCQPPPLSPSHLAPGTEHLCCWPCQYPRAHCHLPTQRERQVSAQAVSIAPKQTERLRESLIPM